MFGMPYLNRPRIVFRIVCVACTADSFEYRRCQRVLRRRCELCAECGPREAVENQDCYND